MATGAAVGAVAEANTQAAASASSYAAGVATGEAIATPPGGVYTTLPGNCLYKPTGATNYFQCGGMWLAPSYGANGLYYKVVPAP